MIEKMKAICIVTQNSRRQALLDALRDLEILHVAEKRAAEPALLERFAMLSRIMPELKDYATSDSADEILSDDRFETEYHAAAKALEKKNSIKTKQAELRMEADRLRPWGEFDAQILRDLAKRFDLHFLRMDKKAYKALAKNPDVRFIRLASVEKMETVAVIGAVDNSIPATEFAIPQRGIAELQSAIDDLQKELDACEATLKESAKHMKSYSEQLLKAQNDIEYSAVGESLTRDDALVWISGYLPESEVATFEKAAKEQNWAWVLNDIPEDDANVPTKIRYNKLTALIRPIFDILGVVPGYREYDISFWFMAFFSLFFAMIIGDAGYGALFLVGTILFRIKAKKTTNMTLLLAVLSVSTIVWGSLTGTWFGLEGAMKIPLLKALVVPGFANYPQYFSVTTTDVQNNVMKFCFSIGVIQLALACIMNIRRKCVAKNLSWVADVGWLCSISALYFMVLYLVIGQQINFALIASMVGAGFLLVVLFGGMAPGKSFAQGLKAGLGDAFTVFLNTISAFGNIMSYIRLFAVGMASLAIAQSFNDMAAGFDGALVIVGAVIMVIGHVLNIIMGFLSVVVHGVRLNLLEFSGQLGMEWSGVAYNPFKKIKNKK